MLVNSKGVLATAARDSSSPHHCKALSQHTSARVNAGKRILVPHHATNPNTGPTASSCCRRCCVFVFQGTTCVFSKKVEYLHNLVYQALETIFNKRSQAKQAAAGASGAADKVRLSGLQAPGGGFGEGCVGGFLWVQVPHSICSSSSRSADIKYRGAAGVRFGCNVCQMNGQSSAVGAGGSYTPRVHIFRCTLCQPPLCSTAEKLLLLQQQQRRRLWRSMSSCRSAEGADMHRCCAVDVLLTVT